jgi:hypothetical protein
METQQLSLLYIQKELFLIKKDWERIPVFFLIDFIHFHYIKRQGEKNI